MLESASSLPPDTGGYWYSQLKFNTALFSRVVGDLLATLRDLLQRHGLLL